MLAPRTMDTAGSATAAAAAAEAHPGPGGCGPSPGGGGPNPKPSPSRPSRWEGLFSARLNFHTALPRDALLSARMVCKAWAVGAADRMESFNAAALADKPRLRPVAGRVTVRAKGVRAVLGRRECARWEQGDDAQDAANGADAAALAMGLGITRVGNPATQAPPPQWLRSRRLLGLDIDASTVDVAQLQALLAVRAPFALSLRSDSGKTDRRAGKNRRMCIDALAGRDDYPRVHVAMTSGQFGCKLMRLTRKLPMMLGSGLRELRLGNCKLGGALAMPSVLPCLRNVTALDIHHSDVGDRDLRAALSSLGALTELDVGYNGIREETLCAVAAQLPRLRSLGSAWNENSAEAVERVAAMPQLTSLDVSMHNFCAAGVLFRSSCLTSLVANNAFLDDDDIYTIGGLAGLTDLDLSCNYISTAAALAPLLRLRALDLSWNTLADVAVAVLGALPAVESLDVRMNSLSEAAMAALVGCAVARRPDARVCTDLDRRRGDSDR